MKNNKIVPSSEYFVEISDIYEVEAVHIHKKIQCDYKHFTMVYYWNCLIKMLN